MALHRITTPQGTAKQYRTKNGHVKVSLEWNEGFGPKYTRKFNNAQEFVDNEVLRLCDPYVPFDTGFLKASGQVSTVIGSGEVVWNTPYARYLYYGKLMLTEDGRAFANFGETKVLTDKDLEYQNGRTPHWFDKAMQNGGAEQIRNGVARYIGRGT